MPLFVVLNGEQDIFNALKTCSGETSEVTATRYYRTSIIVPYEYHEQLSNDAPDFHKSRYYKVRAKV